MLAALAIPAMLVCACSATAGTSAVPQSAGPGTTGSGITGSGTTGSGQQVTQGGGLHSTPGHQQSGVYSGRYSAAFAQCMRANGVPGFPDWEGKSGDLSVRGVATHSAPFQSALFGACESLAPAEWVAAQPLGPLPAGGSS